MGNAGLFRNVRLEQGLATERDKRLLTTASGPLNPDAFLSFVRRAVQERWVESDRMNRTDRPVGPRILPRSDPGDAHDSSGGAAGSGPPTGRAAGPQREHRASEVRPMKHNVSRRLLAALLAAGLATAAMAGGPLYTYDYENRIPYAWNMASWPNGQVPVYTDLGGLGVLTNARANELVTFAANQWSSVPTSSFRSAVVGDVSALGLGDIDANSVQSVLGEWNGGGMDVIYDHDGSILTNFFGLPPTGVLGITNIDFVEADGPEILEAWMVLSGPGIHAERSQRSGLPGRRHARDGARAQPGPQPGERCRVEPQRVRLASAGRMRRTLGGWAGLPPRSRPCTRSASRSRGRAASTWATVDRIDDQGRPVGALPRSRLSRQSGGRSAARSWMPREPRSRASTSSRETSPIPSTISRPTSRGRSARDRPGPTARSC